MTGRRRLRGSSRLAGSLETPSYPVRYLPLGTSNIRKALHSFRRSATKQPTEVTVDENDQPRSGNDVDRLIFFPHNQARIYYTGYCIGKPEGTRTKVSHTLEAIRAAGIHGGKAALRERV